MLATLERFMKTYLRRNPRVAIFALVTLFFARSVHASDSSNGSIDIAISRLTALSSDQNIFESMELDGGIFSVGRHMPFGGGNMVSGTDYIYSNSTGGLGHSPLTEGPQIETPVIQSLCGELPLPAIEPTRYLQAGKVFSKSTTAKRRVSYVEGGIRYDYLADDGETVVESAQFSNYQKRTLTGIMENAPEEFMAEFPLPYWIKANNFVANLAWKPGAAYVKKQGFRVGDTYLALDCTNTASIKRTVGTETRPCRKGATLDKFFPATLLAGSARHPYETDFAGDGTISMVQGLRMWVANAPRPRQQYITPTYRIFYELNGDVYMGALQKDRTQIHYLQQDGSIVSYSIGLNQAAVSSIKQGLITSAAPGAHVGSVHEIVSEDIFGIGGHGVNGALTPEDLRTHYRVPGNLDGSGQTLVIVYPPVTADIADDLNVFSQYYNLPQCNNFNKCFQHIDLSKGVTVANEEFSSVEVAMDTQLVHAIAPGANIILVSAASDKPEDLVDAINYAAKLKNITAVSLSFSDLPLPSSETAYPDQDGMFKSFVTDTGVIFFASSGDAGYSQKSSHYPAQSPYVTAVGGTRIKSTNWTSSALSEVAWEFSGSANGYANMPFWQSSYLDAKIIAANGGKRAFPDVAAVADPQHSAVAIYFKQHWYMEGGTSAATPIWAGISAIFGQFLANKGQSLSVLVRNTNGGFNGLLYHLSAKNRSTSPFHDIVYGSNNLTSKDCAICTSSVGYDNVTGLGSPDVTALIANF